MIQALGISPSVVAIAALIILYVFLVGDWFHRAWSALGIAAILVAIGGLSIPQALSTIDLNTLSLLVGMMVLVGLLGAAGLFHRMGRLMQGWTEKDPRRFLWVIFGSTAIASAFLDNVTTILLLAPTVFAIAEALDEGVDPVPWLMVMIVASNLGGMATLIGDPPNILIGTAAGLTFNQFITLLLPGSLCVLAGLALMFRLPSFLPPGRRRVGTTSRPLRQSLYAHRLTGLLVILGLTLGALVFQYLVGLSAGTIALCGALLAMIYAWPRPRDLVKFIDWGTIGFFVGIFILVGAIEQHGVARHLARLIMHHPWGPWLPLVIFVGAAIFSAVLDNVPLVAAGIPVVRLLVQHEPQWGNTLWVALAMGAAIGGNATITGASANVVAQGLAMEHGYSLDFRRYLPFGIKVFVGTGLVTALYIWWRF